MKKSLIIILAFCFIAINIHSQIKEDLSEALINSTIKISGIEQVLVNGKNKNLYVSGTGFFFGFNLPKGFFPVIVTNYHVIKDCNWGFLTFTNADSSGNPIYGKAIIDTLYDFKHSWLRHPDTSVDLAVLPIGPILNTHAKRKEKILFIPFVENIIPNDSINKSLHAIEDIYMIGYPFGKRDEINNIPIVRKGITATPAFLNYENNKEFLVDIPVYSGSSGSPILIYSNEYNDKRGGLHVGNRIILLGINYATFLRNYEGKIIPKITYDLDESNSTINTQIPYNT
jgi:hypothetical protein